MEPFKFVDYQFDKAEPITGYTSFEWVERYLKPGEFEIKAPMESGLFEQLPLYTFISHVNTYEMAFVENIEIKDDGENDPELTISGRTIDALMDFQITGFAYWTQNQTSSNPNPEYTIASNYIAVQVATIINNERYATYDWPLIAAVAPSAVSTAGDQAARTLKKEKLSKTVMDLLQVYDFGIRSKRMNPFGVTGSAAENRLVVHKGENRTDEVVFSWRTGDLKAADYLWSSKSRVDMTWVMGKWVGNWSAYGTIGNADYQRQVVLVSASDLDDSYSAIPSSGDYTALRAKMYERAKANTQGNVEVNITSVEVSPTTQWRYRDHYDIGDLVTVDGNYGEVETRRVVEFAEIEDEEGESAFPTLEIIPSNAIV